MALIVIAILILILIHAVSARACTPDQHWGQVRVAAVKVNRDIHMYM